MAYSTVIPRVWRIYLLRLAQPSNIRRPVALESSFRHPSGFRLATRSAATRVFCRPARALAGRPVARIPGLVPDDAPSHAGRRSGRGDLSLARRGRGGLAAPLHGARDPGVRVSARARQRLVASAPAVAATCALRIQVRHRPSRRGRMDQRSAQPASRRRSVRRELGLPDLGLRGPRLGDTGPGRRRG